jgi:hypothetical protein
MKNRNEYLPEDFEALLAEKSFSDLYPEEKAFVLEHLTSAKEYEQTRELLLALRGSAGAKSETDDLNRPSPQVKKDLLSAFDQEKKRRVAYWWNGVGLLIRDRFRFDLPVMRYGFAAVTLLLGIWLVLRLNKNENPQAPQLVNNPTKQIIPEKVKQQNPVISPENQKDETPVVKQVIPNEGMPTPITNNQIQQPIIDSIIVPNQNPQQIVQNPNPYRQEQTMNDTSASLAVNFSNASGFTNPTTGNAINPLFSNSDSAVCCGGTTVNFTSVSGSMNYNWNTGPLVTNSNMSNSITNNPLYVIYTSPQSRSLAADTKAIGLFYQLK